MPTADGAERAEVILGVWVDNLNYDPAIRLLSLNDAAKAMYVNRAGNVVTVGVSMTHDEAHEQLLRTSAAYERVMASGGLSQALTGVAARGQDAPLNRGSSRGGGKKTKKDANNCAAARARQEATRNCTRRRGPGEYGACVERHMQAQKDVFNYCG
jgi:hypothetical protein